MDVNGTNNPAKTGDVMHEKWSVAFHVVDGVLTVFLGSVTRNNSVTLLQTKRVSTTTSA
jgi:hypothetical protein